MIRANGIELNVGDRVFTHEYKHDGAERVYGILKLNDHPNTNHLYEYVVEYDDGETYCVIDFNDLHKA